MYRCISVYIYVFMYICIYRYTGRFESELDKQPDLFGFFCSGTQTSLFTWERGTGAGLGWLLCDGVVCGIDHVGFLCCILFDFC